MDEDSSELRGALGGFPIAHACLKTTFSPHYAKSGFTLQLMRAMQVIAHGIGVSGLGREPGHRGAESSY